MVWRCFIYKNYIFEIKIIFIRKEKNIERNKIIDKRKNS